MNNQALVKQLREWADKLAEMPEAGDAIIASLDAYDGSEFDESKAACLLSGRESSVRLSNEAWAVMDSDDPGGVMIHTTEEKARQICPPVPLEEVQVPTETLSDLSGQ